ncbi:death-associated inhibitor of apoptosis 2-like isoform X2 [Mytilus californianus]|uniref:death-associated inhibitor of apoptosis 2-like isoform X2 n=1 Tax=Mytilus californianus TaxID=6549 RepID=UPI002247E872|nr:death-associated inhibitor of apoptosis 2-like isoform X2 [Mytilus californianus]
MDHIFKTPSMAGKMFQPNFSSQTIEPVLIYSSNNFENLKSFGNWHHGKISLLIEAGFKYTGIDDILMCPICNVTTRFNEWCETKEPHEKHLELKPTCEYAKEVSDMKKCRKVVSSTKDTMHVSPTLFLKELRVSELQTSFRVARKLAEKLASDGYLYDGGMDAVRCSSCRVVIEKEELMSNLTVIHARFSPVCTLIMQHIDKDRLTFLHNSWKQSFIPMYPNYIIEIDRRNTFYEEFGNISSERMSHAGFFYVKDKGTSRRIAICHCCGLSLLPWKLQLGPWEAHALLRGFCKYLEVRKGPKYVLDITKTFEKRDPGIERGKTL